MITSGQSSRSTPDEGRSSRTTLVAKPAQFWLQIIALGFISLMIVFHLALAARGMSMYRDQHLGTALEYAKGRIDLLRPVIVGFDATGSPIAQEVPIWQATAALFFKCFGLWFGWANVTSLLYMIAGLWPVFQIAKSALGERGAWWTLILFVAQPLIFAEGGRGGTDGSCATAMFWFLFCAEKLVRSGEFKWFFPSVIAGALSATTKLPFFFCAGLACLFLLVLQFRSSVRRWVLLSGVGLIVLALFGAWTHYTNKLVTNAEFPFVDLRVSGQATEGVSTFWWYFGDLHYRLNPGVWGKAAWRFFGCEFGSFALVGLAVTGFFRIKSSWIWCWFVASIITVLIFTHVILNHENYYLMISPVVAMSCAAAVIWLEDRISETHRITAKLFPGITAVVLGLSTVQGLIAMKVVLDTDRYPHRIAKLIDEHTGPSDKLLVQGGGWGGEELFLADRTGLSIWNTKIAEDPQKLQRLRQLGYTKLVMIGSSPLLAALEQVNPGSADVRRRSYREALTPTAEGWPTIFQSDDLLIKTIPPQ
ncbi:MAG TPA: glycosyltransferase family 39 protein [Verrucomicrobiae bacterium]|nr:glycosyltransferase family 39 protein [Verrucomicrobiae bacterium]